MKFTISSSLKAMKKQILEENEGEVNIKMSASAEADALSESLSKEWNEELVPKLESLFTERSCGILVPQTSSELEHHPYDKHTEMFSFAQTNKHDIWVSASYSTRSYFYVYGGNITEDSVKDVTLDKGLAAKIVHNFKATDTAQQTEPFVIMQYKGKYIRYQVTISRSAIAYSSANYTLGYALVIQIPASNPFMKKLMVTLDKDENWVKAAVQSLRYWYDNESFPMAFDLGTPIPTPSTPILGVTKIGSSFFYVPSAKEVPYDRRKQFLQKTISSNQAYLPSNQVISINPAGNIQYTNSNGDFEDFDISGAMKVTDEDKYSVLRRPVNDVLLGDLRGSLSAIYPYRKYMGDKLKSYEDFIIANATNPVGEVQPQSILLDYLSVVSKYWESRFGEISPITFFSFKGLLSLIASSLRNYDKIKSSVSSKRASFDEASANDVPSIPCISQAFSFLPHQAEALAKLDKAQQIAILDVSTGGGKTITVVSDILNLMARGKIKRALVVMPNALCGQYASEIIEFTQGQVNAFVINTESVNSWGEDRIWSAAATAPGNTIFISSYDFLSNPSSIDMYEWGPVYNNVEKVKRYVNPDYIALDEAHFIKNENSNRHAAIMQLSSVEYRRIATGTLITNNPFDLPGQIGFLNPMAVGDRDEFAARYAIRGNASNGWKSNADDLIRRDLELNMFYLNYREKDWAAFLPNVVMSDFFVQMTPQQVKIYKDLVNQVMTEIKSDPALMRAWMKLQEEGEDIQLDYVSPMLLPKMQRLEQYLTSPDISEFAAKALSADDRISPKIGKIDERIALSIQANSKVIVGVHFKYSALHLLRNSKYKDVAVYYDAQHKQNLQEFKNNPDVKVMFAVIQSITEGHNLQMADRIIIADVDWTPGKLKQFIARIYRPHIKKNEKGELVNLNAGKTVYIDTILANNSADCIKWAFQTRKKIFNSRIMERCPVELSPAPSFTEDAFTADFDSRYIQGTKVRNKSNEYNAWQQQQVAEAKAKNPNPRFIRPPDGAVIKDQQVINVPWVRGMNLPVELTHGGVTLSQWLEDEGIIVTDYREAKDKLTGLTVLTDSGLGVVSKVNKSSITVKLETGNAYNITPGTAIKVDDIKVNVKKAAKAIKSVQQETQPVVKKRKKAEVEPAPIIEILPEEPEVRQTQKPAKNRKEAEFDQHSEPTKADYKVELEFALINDMAAIIAWPLDEDTADFSSYGFRLSRPSWEFHIKSKKLGLEVLNKLASKYHISDEQYDQCYSVIQESTRGRFKGENASVEDLRNFYKIAVFKKAKPGNLKIYPIVWFDEPYLMVDIQSHPGVNLTRYRFTRNDEVFLYKLCKNAAELKAVIRAIQADGLKITNLQEFKGDARESGFRL